MFAKRKIQDMSTEEVLRSVDKESNRRELTGVSYKIVAIIAILFSVFEIYVNAFYTLETMIIRCIHLSFGFMLIFLIFPGSKKGNLKKIHVLDITLATISAAVPMYIVFNFENIVRRAGSITYIDMIVGIIAIILVLEITRRVVGWPMIILALLFIFYGLFGRYFPKAIAHKGLSLINLIQHQFFTLEGIMGIPISVSATFVFLFILFGAFLEKSGMGQLFIDLANSIAGSATGGPAKVSVMASGFMGTITGSTTANVVGTGSFTIPMMKRLGYSPEFAGAVEAAASTGGQIMPPIMGAAAFLIAEFTNTPYLKVAVTAFIPALLYYLGLWAGVHFEAKKLKLRGMRKDELPKIKETLKERGHLLIPIIAIIVILVMGYTPIKAGLFAIIITIICSQFRKSTRLTLRDIIECLRVGALNTLGVLAACACAGIIIGVITQTGVGLKLGSALVSIAHGNLFLTLFFTMIASIILGMGVPTTANYVITSTIAAPALLLLGVPILVSHMFAFYFGIIADITPPVCLAAVAGAGIAKGEPIKTGIQSTRLAVAAFVVPFIFAFKPSFIMFDRGFLWVLLNIPTAVIGVITIASALTGFLFSKQTVYERIMSLAGGLFLVIPGYKTDIAGLVILVICVIINLKKTIKTRQQEVLP